MWFNNTKIKKCKKNLPKQTINSCLIVSSYTTLHYLYIYVYTILLLFFFTFKGHGITRKVVPCKTCRTKEEPLHIKVFGLQAVSFNRVIKASMSFQVSKIFLSCPLACGKIFCFKQPNVREEGCHMLNLSHIFFQKKK